MPCPEATIGLWRLPHAPSQIELWNLLEDHVHQFRRLQESDVNTTGTSNNVTVEESSNATEAPGVPPADWNCIGLDDGGFLCFSTTLPAYGMGPGAPSTAVPYFFCETDTWLNNNYSATTTTVPQRPLCTDLCVIQDSVSETLCNSCKLLGTGELAYDCTNIYNNPPEDDDGAFVCNSRNEFGQCAGGDVKVYEAFHCIAEPFVGGGGYSCIPSVNVPYLLNGVLELSPLLFCENIVEGGLTLDLCGSKSCFLYGENAFACDTCRLTTEGRIAYDCTNLFPDTFCARTDLNGTCLEAPPPEPPTPDVAETARKAAADPVCFAKENNQANDHDDGWIFPNMSPTTFNFLSDILALVVRVCFGLAISALYTAVMTWQLSAGHPIPVSKLGQKPGDVVAAGMFARAVNFTLPAMLLVALFLVADLSHSAADLGFSAVTVEQPGKLQPVLSLRTEHRNPARPIQSAGDPLGARTVVYLEKDAEQDPFLLSAERDTLVIDFMAAAAQIGRGVSPFVSGVDKDFLYSWNATMGGIAGCPSYVSKCEEAGLLEIANEIPLDCTSPNMVVMNQISRGASILDDTVRHSALVPNCTFSRERATGIYANTVVSDAPKIMETVQIAGIGSIGIYNVSIGVIGADGTISKSLVLSPSDKEFARDREDWRKGRRVSSVKGVQFGNETILFASAVLASGPEVGVFPGDDGYKRRNSYHIFGEIEGPCPARPSGRSANSLVCMASVVLSCETFEEDFQFAGQDVFFPTGPSSCDLSRVHVIWGANFFADAELVATTAGLFGNVRPQFFDTSENIFMLHGILGALFILGTLVERPEIVTKVRPKVDGVYVAFMFLPVCATIIVFVATWASRKQCLPVPCTAADLLVLGKEAGEEIPTRRGKLEKYPPCDPALVFCLNKNLGEESGVGLVKRESSSSNAKRQDLASTLRDNNILETPIDDCEESKGDPASEKGDMDIERPTNPNLSDDGVSA